MFFSNNEESGFDLRKMQEMALQSFLRSDTDMESLQKINERAQELMFLLEPGAIDKNNPIPDDAPTSDEILQRIPQKEDIDRLPLTTGIFTALKYLTDEETQAQLNLLTQIKSEENEEARADLYKELETIKADNIQAAEKRYFNCFAEQPETVLSAIVKCAPLVVAAHRKNVNAAIEAFAKYKSDAKNKEANRLWRLPYIDIRRITQNLQDRSTKNDLTTEKEVGQDLKLKALQAIDGFRSPHYNLLPYFKSELCFLEMTSPEAHKRAVAILKRLADERYGVAALGSKGIRTRKPVKCIKLMAYLVRRVFTYLYPCDNSRLYNRRNLPSLESKKDQAPVLSLHTASGQPLSRAHGEVHDAVCTLWAAGNEVVTDLMIARTIWPRSNRKGSETFSQTELDTINQLMEDLRLADTTIDATTELRRYKKIGSNDHWIAKSYILPCSVVYQLINGGKYMHRAYKILDTPAFLAYSSTLGHVLTMPLSVLEPWEDEKSKLPRTLRYAQVRTMILARIHHFLSPSFRKKEKTILLERVYEAYEISPRASSDVQKKERTAARKAASNALDRLKGEGVISDYVFRKQSGVYRDICIVM